MSKSLSIEEEQVFWAELFAVMIRREERISPQKSHVGRGDALFAG
jgi:hypothetical protein